MRFEIYDEKKTADVIERPIKLRLIIDGIDLWLAAVDEKGNMLTGGLILSITSTGLITRCYHVSDKLEFQLNKNGQVQDFDCLSHHKEVL